MVTRGHVFLIRSSVRRPWKLLSLDGYDGRRWYPGPTQHDPQVLTDDRFDESYDYEVLAPNQWDLAVATGTTTLLDGDLSDKDLAADGTIHAVEPFEAGAAYRATSRVARPTPAEATSAPTYTPTGTRDWSVDPAHARVARLARSLTSTTNSQHEMAERVCHWLLNTYEYEQGTPPTDNPVDTFLFETKKGSCQHFAGSAAAMLRIPGCHTRLAAGFSTIPNPNGVTMITWGEAHVWVELWLPGIGWASYDPTPPTGGGGGGSSLDDQAETDKPAPDDATEEKAEPLPASSDEDAPDEEDVSPEHADETEASEDVGEQDLDAEYEDLPPPETILEKPIDPIFAEFRDVDAQARAIARDIRRAVTLSDKTRHRGTYETGPRLNTGQLHRLVVGDNRVMSRRNHRTKKPVEFLLAYDESPSILFFRDDQRLAWSRARWAVAQALHHAAQDFAVLGFHGDMHWYKRLRQPFDDEVRRNLITLANKRINSGSGTHTGRATRALQISPQRGRYGPTPRRPGLHRRCPERRKEERQESCRRGPQRQPDRDRRSHDQPH